MHAINSGGFLLAAYDDVKLIGFEEILPELFNAEPYDVHLEYNLKKD